jgi:hypothetical protein
LWQMVSHKEKESMIMKTFSPVSSKHSFKIVMNLVAHFDLELHQMDVKTAFLNGDLKGDVYMNQPEGFFYGRQGTFCLSF